MSDQKINYRLRDKLFLSSFQKYKLYGKFPWSFILNIFLVFLTTAQVILVDSSTTSYTRAEERFFHEQFVDTGQKYEKSYPQKKYLYTLNELYDQVSDSINNYYNLSNLSLENLTYPLNRSYVPLNITYFEYFNKDNNNKYLNYFNISNNNLGPFEKDNKTILIEMLKIIKYFTIDYKVRTFAPYNYGDYFECFIWDIIQKYNFEERNHITVTLNIKRGACEDKSYSKFGFIKGSYWIHVLVLLFSSINLYLTSLSIYHFYKFYYQLKIKYERIYSEQKDNNGKEISKWDLLREKEKNKFFSNWIFIQFLTHILQIFDSILSLYENEDIVVYTQYITGIAACFSYIIIGKYLYHYWQFNSIFNMMNKSIRRLLLYFIGTSPIFLGFIFFGYANFWGSERFTNITLTMTTLLSMMNGDSILDIINDLESTGFFVGCIYSYLFGIMSICVICNLFVSIIEEAYVNTKIKNKDHWVYTFLKVKNNDDDKEITKKKIKKIQGIRSKNIIRMAFEEENNYENINDSGMINNSNDNSFNSSLNLSNNNSLSSRISLKSNKENDIKKFKEMIEKGIEETKKVSNEIINAGNTNIKEEIIDILINNINNLEIKIKKIHNSIKNPS